MGRYNILRIFLFINIAQFCLATSVFYRLQARDLKNLDKDVANGPNPDGFVNVWVNDNFIGRTNYVSENKDPVWADPLVLRDLGGSDEIKFEVRDFDTSFVDSKHHGDVLIKAKDIMRIGKFSVAITNSGTLVIEVDRVESDDYDFDIELMNEL